MDSLLSIFAVPLIAAVVLTGGMLLMNRGSENNPYEIRDSIKDCIKWGSGFFLAFSAEFMILANI